MIVVPWIKLRMGFGIIGQAVRRTIILKGWMVQGGLNSFFFPHHQRHVFYARTRGGGLSISRRAVNVQGNRQMAEKFSRTLPQVAERGPRCYISRQRNRYKPVVRCCSGNNLLTSIYVPYNKLHVVDSMIYKIIFRLLWQQLWLLFAPPLRSVPSYFCLYLFFTSDLGVRLNYRYSEFFFDFKKRIIIILKLHSKIDNKCGIRFIMIQKI